MTAKPITDASRAQIREELPEYVEIRDAHLRDRVIEAWAMALSGSSFTSIRQIQAAGNPNSMVSAATVDVGEIASAHDARGKIEFFDAVN